MKQTYSVSGMTCQGCAASVKEKLSEVEGVGGIVIDLENAKAEINMEHPIPISTLKSALPLKYDIEENQSAIAIPSVEKSKLQQLRPLFLIFGYLFGAAIFLNFKNWNTAEAMLDFMGLFYIVFSFFKFLDLKGFPKSFRMYDPLAKAVPVYGWIYPFLELALGLLFLMQFQVQTALLITLIILGTTTFGVIKTLAAKKKHSLCPSRHSVEASHDRSYPH